MLCDEKTTSGDGVDGEERRRDEQTNKQGGNLHVVSPTFVILRGQLIGCLLVVVVFVKNLCFSLSKPQKPRVYKTQKPQFSAPLRRRLKYDSTWH